MKFTYINMTVIYNLIYWIIVLIYWLLILNIVIRILIKNRKVSSSIAWLLTIYVLPIIGTIIYLLFGEFTFRTQNLKNKKNIYISIKHWIKYLKIHEHIFSKKNSKTASPLFQLCKNRQGIGAISGNHIILLKNFNETIKILIQDISLAKKSIDIIFYIWKTGGSVDQITTDLIKAAKRGVKCRMIIDSIGSTDFFHSHYPDLLKKSGINVVQALHVNITRFFSRRMDLRQHKKMILIDNQISYTGSMNMADPHLFKKKTKIGEWTDIMVRINGPATLAMKITFDCDWEFETGEYTLLSQIKYKKINSYKKITHYNPIQSIASGPGFPKEIIHQALLISLYSARKQIIITTPYFIPSDNILFAICTAAQRGVKVHIIIPKNNDSFLVSWASKVFFSELLKAGVNIYQFKKGLLHTKSILIDKQLSLIGTVNLDIRSLWINFEIILVIDNKNFSNDLFKLQKKYIMNSQIIDTKKWMERPYWHRIIERLSYFLSPLL